MGAIEIPQKILNKGHNAVNRSCTMYNSSNASNKFQGINYKAKSITSPSVLSIRQKFESNCKDNTSLESNSVARGSNPITRNISLKSKSSTDKQLGCGNETNDKKPTSTFYFSPTEECSFRPEKGIISL